jgi:hypothetical protein
MKDHGGLGSGAIANGSGVEDDHMTGKVVVAGF